MVTGGAGYIGSYLVQQLRKQHRKVYVVDIETPRYDTLDFIRCDITDEVAVKALPPVATIYHLAAVSRISDSLASPELAFQTNCIGTRHLLNFAASCGAKFIYASTSCCYDGVSLTPYHYSKWLGEHTCFYYARYHSVPMAAARIFNVYGEHPFHQSPPKLVLEVFADCMRKAKPLPLIGNGSQKRDFIHVYDVVSALMSMNDAQSCMEPLDVCTGSHYSILELAMQLQWPIQSVEGRFFDVDDRQGNAAKTEAALAWKAREDVMEYMNTLRMAAN